MFGYIVMNQPEIKFKDYDLYRSFYCGLCRELRETYGISGQISLSFDLTFVLILFSALYEPPTRKGKTRCLIHPVYAHPVRKNEFTEYVADMNMILTYYKCEDDWKDERKLWKLAYARLLRGKNSRLAFRYRKKMKTIAFHLEQLSNWEKAGEQDIDKMAGCFGKIMEEIFACRHDQWEPYLRRMGFYLGKFVYLMDAYEDVEKDVKNGNYNPFSKSYMLKGFQEDTQKLLMMMLAEACREFEKLPIIKYGDILRNILYSGVWVRFEKVSRKRKEQEKKDV